MLQPNTDEPTLEQRAVEDPLINFAVNWWKHILAALAAVIVIAWVKNVFETTHRDAMRSSADVYGTVRD